MVQSAKKQGVSMEQLAAGRNLLVTRCISCHSLIPVGKYSAQRWPELVESMSERAGLNETQRAQVTAYLVTARQNLP
jgi:cytochrome c2